MTEEPRVLAAWKPPLIVAAIAVSIVGGFYLGGPGLGMAVGAMAATSIIVMAIRHPPLYPIVPAAAVDFRDHLLVVVSDPLEDAEAIEQIAGLARGDQSDRRPAEILVVVPVRHRFLDRWTSDLAPAREGAQRTLVVSLASLARAEVAATAGIGDEDLVQTVEDRLRSYPATAVILVRRSRGARCRRCRRAEIAPADPVSPPPCEPTGASNGTSGKACGQLGPGDSRGAA